MDDGRMGHDHYSSPEPKAKCWIPTLSFTWCTIMLILKILHQTAWKKQVR